MTETFKTSGGDIAVMRKLLPEAIAALSAPRVNRGLTGDRMTSKARAELKRGDQRRLRSMVQSCLRKVYDCWRNQRSADDQVLVQSAVDQIMKIIEDYEASGAQIGAARAGREWEDLRDLVQEIADGLKAEVRTESNVIHEGRNTVLLVQLALKRLGGQASTKDVLGWIEKNIAEAKKLDVKLNSHSTTAKDRPEGTKVWHLTVSACLSQHKDTHWRLRKEDGVYVWREFNGAEAALGNKKRRLQ